MKRSWVVVVAVVTWGCLFVLGAACEGSATTGSDRATDARARRPTPTAEEEDPGAPTCVAGDAAAVEPPTDYAERTNPLPATNDVVAAGATLFASRCALCHGDEGRGDGQEGPFATPPADFTLRRRSDAYLFWRISRGGRFPPFCSAMPAFEGIHTETQRWQLVTFIQETFAPDSDAGANGDGG